MLASPAAPLPADFADDEAGAGPAQSPYGRLPGGVWSVFVVLALFGLLTPNPLLTAVAVLAIPVFVMLLWRPGEPPVLLFAVGFQWIQVTARVFQANSAGLPLAQFGTTPTVVDAMWLGLAALGVLAVGMRVAMRRLPVRDPDQLAHEVEVFSVGRAFVLWVVLSVLATAIRSVAWSGGGFTQVLFTLTALRWIGVFLLGYLVLSKRQGYLYLAVAVGVEFVQGIGFFSGFTTVIFVMLITGFTVYTRIDARATILGLATLILLLFFGSAWTLVKPAFRGFLTEGQVSQTATVGGAERLGMAVELVSQLNLEDLVAGIDPLLGRVGYVDYFAYTMDFVPMYRPHERGGVWQTAFQHVFQPRLFFPDKPVLPSDSEHTMAYTGLNMASDEAATSISIGYVGDSYIDFGRWGLFIPVLVLGMLWGVMYSFFVNRARVQTVGYAMVIVVLLLAAQFEIVALKLLGGITLNFLVFWILMRVVERPLARWLSAGAWGEQTEEGFEDEGWDPGAVLGEPVSAQRV